MTAQRSRLEEEVRGLQAQLLVASNSVTVLAEKRNRLREQRRGLVLDLKMRKAEEEELRAEVRAPGEGLWGWCRALQ